jgi:hypothetical protein
MEWRNLIMATYDQTNPEIIGLAEQKALAKSLREHGMKQNLQGQMVSGRFVGASPLQGLADLLNIHTGKSMEREIAQKEKDIIQQQQMAQNANLQQGLNEYYGTPEFTQQGPTPTGGNIPVQPAMQPDRRMALATLLAPQGGATSKAIASKLLEKEFEAPKRQVVAPGGALVDENGKLIYQAPYRPLAGDGESGMGEGRFNKKGDYIAPGGVFIGKTEVAKDREIARTANELRQGLQEISPKDVKATESIFGSVVEGGPISYLAKQFKNPAVAAQAKVNASAVMQTLQNLPPGPASDKDIAQAKSSFPGYGNAEDLQTWINNTNTMLERKINNVNAKYGSEDWYGAQGIGTKQPTPKNAEDQAALAWANANPGDPRSAKIKQRLSGAQ